VHTKVAVIKQFRTGNNVPIVGKRHGGNQNQAQKQ